MFHVKHLPETATDKLTQMLNLIGRTYIVSHETFGKQRAGKGLGQRAAKPLQIKIAYCRGNEMEKTGGVKAKAAAKAEWTKHKLLKP